MVGPSYSQNFLNEVEANVVAFTKCIFLYEWEGDLTHLLGTMVLEWRWICLFRFGKDGGAYSLVGPSYYCYNEDKHKYDATTKCCKAGGNEEWKGEREGLGQPHPVSLSMKH